MSYSKTTLGRFLRRHRQITLRETAQALGVSEPYLSGVERGQRTISPEKLEQLLQVLNLPDKECAVAWKARNRLPPRVERYFLKHAEKWP